MAPGDGSMAETVVVPRGRRWWPCPRASTPAEVAALGLSAVAAYMALTWRGELAAGETVIVLGAGGVVGQAAVQLARLHGAARVVAAARSQAGQQRALAAGADAVVALDTDDVGELAGGSTAAATARSTWCSTRCSAYPPPRPRVPARGRPAGQPRRLRRRACPLDSATLRSRSLRLLGYTNNALDGPAARG